MNVLYTCIVANWYVGAVCIHIELHGNNFERSNKEQKIKQGGGKEICQSKGRAITLCGHFMLDYHVRKLRLFGMLHHTVPA